MDPYFAVLLAAASLFVSFVDSTSDFFPADLFSRKEEREIARAEYRALQRLNLASESIEEPLNASTTPRYLFDLYDVVERNATHTETGAERDAVVARDANVIEVLLAEPNHSSNDSNRTESGSGVPRAHLRFRTPDLHVVSLVGAAELRLHREIGDPNATTPPFEIVLFQVVRHHAQPHRARLDVRRVESNDRDPIVALNATEAVRSWIAYPETNKGFEIEVKILSDGRRVHPSVVGLENIVGDPDRETILVVFSREDEDDDDDVIAGRSRRDVIARVKRSQQTESSDTGTSDMENSDSECRLRSFYINFRDIGWRHILLPKGFYSNYCGGRCPRFLTSKMNSTNHAWLQNLKYWLGEDNSLPPIGCAPVDYGPIMLLWKNAQGDFKFKKYHSLVAKACGCR